MYDVYFTFRSLTGAQRALRVLEQARIPAALQRTPKQLEQLGCGYAIRVNMQTARNAGRELLRGGAQYRKVYRRYAGGWWEEGAV